jgi:hypothetical protein
LRSQRNARSHYEVASWEKVSQRSLLGYHSPRKVRHLDQKTHLLVDVAALPSGATFPKLTMQQTMRR